MTTLIKHTCHNCRADFHQTTSDNIR